MLSDTRTRLAEKIFNISNDDCFEEVAMEMFRYQYRNNNLYRRYLELLGADPAAVVNTAGIPCLPLSFFRNHDIYTGSKPGSVIFRSSGTGSTTPSVHYVADTGLYEKSIIRCFEMFYGDPGNYCILALLPSYIERGDSSLVYMAEGLIKRSGHLRSGFYRDDPGALTLVLQENEKNRQKTLLLGVSFALLDLFPGLKFRLENTIIVETGGMKGRRKEITREELHKILKSATGLGHIHSEYGMTELLSQAWSKGNGIFNSPPWMKVLIRDAYNPFTYLEPGRSGGINIIDLANIDSCAFLETADLGRMLPEGGFEVLGRFDNSDIRGCNLLTE